MKSNDLFQHNCAILERTADDVSVGRCFHWVGAEDFCPRHGDVRQAMRIYRKTGKLTEEEIIAPHEVPTVRS